MFLKGNMSTVLNIKDNVLLHWNGYLMNVDIYVDLDVVGKIFKGARGRILGISPKSTIIEAFGFTFII